MAYHDVSDLDAAKYDVVHDFKPGLKKLAAAVRINYGTLCNKVNPTLDTHHLTVDEAVAIQLFTHDVRIIEAEARALGGVFVSIPVELANVGDVELLNAWARWQSDIGQTATAIEAALKDGNITRAELADIRAEMFSDFARELELLSRLEAICAEGRSHE